MHPIWNALLGWGAALFATLLFIGLGRSMARLLGVKDCGHGVAFASGSWLMALLLMGCALSRPTAPTPSSLMWTEVLFAALLCVPIAIHGWRSFAPKPVPWRTRLGGIPLWLCGALLLLWLAPYLLQTLLPDTDWDAAMYHRPTAMRIIEQGVTSTDPYRAQLNFPALIPVFYAGFMACGLQSAMTPFNMIAALLTAWTTYEVGRRYFGPTVGLWAVGLVLTTNILWELATDHRSDGFLALYFMTALCCALAVFQDPKRLGFVPLLGMSMGLAFGTKLTGLLAIGLFGGSTFLVLVVQRPRRYVRWLLLGVVFMVVPGGFWAARNAIELNDPVYPFTNGLLYRNLDAELRPFYPDFEPLYARSEKPPAHVLRDPGGQKEPGTILNLVDVFWDSERYQNKDYHWLQPLLFLAFLLPLVDRRRSYLWLWGAGCLCFLILGFRAHLVRYAVAAYPILALGAAAFLAHPRIRRIPTVFWCALFLTVGIGIHNHVRTWIKVDRLCPLDYLLQQESPYDWQVRRGHNRDTRTSWAAHLVNRLIQDGEMPRASTILMVAESKFELFGCSTIPDVSAEGYLWLTEYLKGGGDYHRIKANLRKIGVTHILVNGGQIDWALNHLKMDSKLQNMDYLRFSAYHALRFVEEHGTNLFEEKFEEKEANSVFLYRLDYD